MALFKMDETNEHLRELWKSAERVADEGRKAILSMPKNAALDKSPNALNNNGFKKTLHPLSVSRPLAVNSKPRVALPVTMSMIFLALTVGLYLSASTTLAFIFAIPTAFFYIVILRAVWIRLKP
jgi:hypothetical protein